MSPRFKYVLANIMGLMVIVMIMIGYGLAQQRIFGSPIPPVDQYGCATPHAATYPVPAANAERACSTAVRAAYPLPQQRDQPGIVSPHGVPPVAVPDSLEPLPPLIVVREGNLWRSDGSGTPLRRLTNVDGVNTSAGSPIFSPDGRQIAFVMVQPPAIGSAIPFSRMSLYVLNTDGSNLRVVWNPDHAFLWRPTWAADGQSIYVAAQEWQQDASTSVVHGVQVDLASGRVQPIIPDAVSFTASRDGRWLAFVHLVDGYKTELAIATPSGTGTRIVIAAERFQEISAPRFAPNSTQIVFTAIGGPTVDPNGNPVAAAPPTFFDHISAWVAPAAAHAHGQPYDIWVVNSDGTGLRRLTWFLADSTIVAYSLDGTEMIINSGTGIYRMRADGSNLRRLDAVGDHTSGGIDWSPAP